MAGIGRHARLKIECLHRRAGSTPARGTNQKNMPLTLFLGPMFAGKTTALITAASMDPDTLVLRPVLDTRSPSHKVRSHDGREYPCETVSSLHIVDDFGYSQILVDEIQFFKPNSVGKLLTWSASGKNVQVFGLSEMADGTPWPIVEMLKRTRPKTVWLSSRCQLCAEPATKTQRLTPWTEGKAGIAVGGAMDYAPRCMKHWSPKP